ncbi:MAG: CoA activase [Proteobacteria bacterium]|nr:CoA activase [Pseudomonadota bacterium]
MNLHSNILGVDIGSVSVSLVEMTPEKKIIRTEYLFHHGSIRETLKQAISRFRLQDICGIASTSSTPLVLKVNRQYDNRIAVMRACRFFHGTVSGILIVGGERFGLIQFDDEGNYLKFKSNTSCAAGTGSFLDQQAERLGLENIEALSDMADENIDTVPQIATRCSVFAKTDLVHAQQEGYSLNQIADGLCRGLAKNIVDTLFGSGRKEGLVVFSGGVSRNTAVVRHIRSMINQEIQIEKTLYGAAGAALHLLDEMLLKDRISARAVADILLPVNDVKKNYYPPLTLQKSIYPEFTSFETFKYHPAGLGPNENASVEVDIYEKLNNKPLTSYLGIDVGSTSTKAILMGRDKHVLAGFYTRTAGRPVDAIRNLFAAIHFTMEKYQNELHILGAGTTGAGRKFVGKIIGADLVIDEITAHARAAVEIDPAVDTIIEIGGQDSKFTTLKNGQVVFSVMNTVCATGTGSFIEEQAKKLSCPLSEYSRRTENRPSPMVSDRCTVFMERDLNHYLSEGYAREDVLASVLHAIVENYLSKVAVEGNIGNVVFFQGATAKNKSLVAAFEQRLQKSIQVSRYCHLTGALGTALSLFDQQAEKSQFEGIDLYKKEIPISSEVCGLCTNHCKITLADRGEKKVAYGFLCGRDYDTERFVDNNRSGFDLVKNRKTVWNYKSGSEIKYEMTIGLPEGVYMKEDLVFWKYFFDKLSIPTLSGDGIKDAVKKGKEMAGAEFCAPMAAFHAHVANLLERTDYVFLPYYLERKVEEKNRRRHFCYYSQFAPASISATIPPNLRYKLLMPLVSYLYSSFHDKVQLYRMFKSILPGKIGFLDVSSAYDAAISFRKTCEQKLRKIYQQASGTGDFHVVLMGRPYTVLSPDMNKRIPNIFGKLGVKAFFQDMLAYSSDHIRSLEPLLDEIPWNYAARILESALVVARKQGAYPVLVTSFKCTPDAFVVDYFKKIMALYDKPHLILQLDDHDSSVGYETRIEAALRSFKNHYQFDAPLESEKFSPIVIHSRIKTLDRRTLLLPNWDNLSMRLVQAALIKEGIDARLLSESADGIRKSLRHNTGQCIPLNIVAQECTDYIERHNLNPEETALWTVKSSLACNLPLFPLHIKNLFSTWGKGMEKTEVYAGALSFMDISVKLPPNIYFAYMFGGMIRKIGCQIRPYEQIKGETDRTIEKSIHILSDAFLGRRSKEDALLEILNRFQVISMHNKKDFRPKVAIFGDLYVRDNTVMNQDLIHFIEENGGEVVATPYSSYLKMICKPYLQKWFREGLYFNVLSGKALMVAMKQLEKTYDRYFQKILKEPGISYDEPLQKIFRDFNIKVENNGESIENILKVYYTQKQYPDISLFVQTSPAFCCPSLVTESMADEIERQFGVPIVSVTYDGTGGNKNEAIIPYLQYPKTQSGRWQNKAQG